MQCNSLGNSGAYALAEMLLKSNRLVELNLNQNGIQTHGALMLAEAICLSHIEISLDISSNPIGLLGVHALLGCTDYASRLVLQHIDAPDSKSDDDNDIFYDSNDLNRHYELDLSNSVDHLIFEFLRYRHISSLGKCFHVMLNRGPCKAFRTSSNQNK